MSALDLTLYITLAILLQVAAFAVAAFYRRWRAYRDMRHRLNLRQPQSLMA